MNSALTQSKLKEFLQYDPESGIFTWLKSPGNRIKAGDSAGSKRRNGYLNLRLGKTYLAHRLAFLFMTGEFPKMVDHINGCKSDNRWVNLREVDTSENGKNAPIPITNKSGVIGVRWRKEMKKWVAKIKVNQRDYHLGYFSELADAAAARTRAEKDFGFHPNHGRRAA